ncbi:unnamed protein product, partial [Discosporangium mesarthrocarpum]
MLTNEPTDGLTATDLELHDVRRSNTRKSLTDRARHSLPGMERLCLRDLVSGFWSKPVVNGSEKKSVSDRPKGHQGITKRQTENATGRRRCHAGVVTPPFFLSDDGREVSQEGEEALRQSALAYLGVEVQLKTLVLKLTTGLEREDCRQSFEVGTSGASIGNASMNTVCIPWDNALAPFCHATLQYRSRERTETE